MSYRTEQIANWEAIRQAAPVADQHGQITNQINGMRSEIRHEAGAWLGNLAVGNTVQY
jgi:hypothetical protein